MARSSAARRFTLVPAPFEQSLAAQPTIRPAIAALTQDNLALDANTISLPEDKGPDSQVMIKQVRSDLRPALDASDEDELDVFDWGIGDDEVSGDFDRSTMLAQTELVEELKIGNDITPPLPPEVPLIAQALRLKLSDDEMVECAPVDDHLHFNLVTKKPIIEDLDANEQRLWEIAVNLSRRIKSNPSSTFAQVAEASRMFTRQGKDMFWPALRTAIAYPPRSPNETIAQAVERHSHVIESTALQVLAHETTTRSFSLEALEIGFHSLPAYRDQPTRLAMNKALREKVAELRPIAHTVVQVIHQGINTRSTYFDTLQSLMKLPLQKRAIAWKFHALLRKKSPPAKAGEDITQVYQKQINTIATRVLQETFPRTTIHHPALEVGYQLLPNTGDPKDEIKLRKALLQRVNDELVLVGLKKPAQELVLNVKAAPFAKETIANQATATLSPRQQALFPEAVKRAAAPEIVKMRRELTERSTIAKILVENLPHKKAKILERLGQGLSPLEHIMFREQTGNSVLNNGLFGDYARLGLVAPDPREKLPPIPVSKVATTPLPETIIEDYTDLVEPGLWKKFTTGIKDGIPNLWKRFTTGIKEGVDQVKNWFGDRKKNLASFSFMNFVRGHRRVVTLTTAVAALNAREAYLNYTTELAPMAQAPSPDEPRELMYTPVQEAAFSTPMGTNSNGTRLSLNYVPVGLSRLDQFWHNVDVFTPKHLSIASAHQSTFTTPGYQQVNLHSQTAVITQPWELRVDQHDAMANVFNVLDAYMRTRTFRLAYPQYRPGAQDQSTLFDALARYSPRAHHILHRIAHGDVINLGINLEGHIVITSWTNAQGINMLAGEPPIAIRMHLPNLGEFSRSPVVLARMNGPAEQSPNNSRLALLQ